ncbi:MAG TPA: hypothetical protein VLA19_15890 [Herpetosiphonaceae bacterium]|nr:hypothetical protein [Herpetosiphonaceae bacterium]
MTLELPLPPLYRFDAMINAHGWPQLAPFAWDAEQRMLGRVEQLSSGRIVSLHIRADGEVLRVELELPEPDADELGEVERVVRWMVELDEDFSEFYNFCAGYEALQHIPTRGLGPMLRSPTVWEDYVKTVCTTNTTWGQTKGMVRRMVDGYGAALSEDGPRAFPSPAMIAAVTADEFATTVRAGYRAPYIYATAVEIAEGRLDLESFKQVAREIETPELMRALSKLRGIGLYAAAHMALLLGSYGHIPVDSWARDLVRRHLRGGEPVTDKEVHAHFEHFGRWKALAFNCWNWEGTAAPAER